jgi:hypothetical protein
MTAPPWQHRRLVSLHVPCFHCSVYESVSAVVSSEGRPPMEQKGHRATKRYLVPRSHIATSWVY